MQTEVGMRMIFVVGGINTDISGRPQTALLLRDSNISRIGVSIGGVGRNIAYHLAKAGMRVELIAALGDDIFSAGVEQDCRKHGIGLSYAPRIPKHRGGIYLCVNDEGGDMYVALNDMDICAFLTPDRIDMAAMNSAQLCILDANIPAQTLLFIAQNAKVPLVCDPVSVAKCERVRSILPYLYAIKPNLYEARALTGRESPSDTAQALVQAGVKQVFVSLGSEGMCYADQYNCGFCKVEAQRPIVSTTGAGDAAAAAVCIAVIEKLSIEKAALAACNASVKLISQQS